MSQLGSFKGSIVFHLVLEVKLSDWSITRYNLFEMHTSYMYTAIGPCGPTGGHVHDDKCGHEFYVSKTMTCLGRAGWK